MTTTYYISFDSGSNWLQFYPTNEPRVFLKREADEVFSRWKVDFFKIGATKNTSVYATLLSYFFTPAHYSTDLKYQIRENGVTTFEFIGSVLLGKNDSQNSIFECTPDPDDEYRDILIQYDKKFDNRTANQLFGVYGNVYYPAIGTGTFNNVDFSTWSDSAQVVAWTNAVFTTTQTARLALGTVAVDYIIYVRIKDYVLTAGDQPKLQLINTTSGASVSNQVTITGNGFYTLTKSSASVNTSIEFSEYNQLPDAGVASGSFTYDYYDASTIITGGGLFRTILESCLNGASYMNLSIGTAYSTILWNDAVESDAPTSIASYMTAHPTYDYVLGAEAILNYLWLGRADGPSSTNLDNIQVSLKDMMNQLKKIRLCWFIDADGHFRIEHEKYFRSYTAQIDLTSATYESDKPEVDSKIFTYLRNSIFFQVNYSENNQKTEDWLPYPVEFPITNITPNKQDVRFSELSTDIKNMVENPDTIDNTGFFLARTTYNGTYYTISLDPSTITPANSYPNAYLSWAYVFTKYHDYFAESNTGTINGSTAHNYTHVKEILHQENIKFHTVGTFSWKKPVTTSRGTGWLVTAEYVPETGMIKINVGYNPYNI